MQKFWVVVNADQSPMRFTFKHDSFASAEQEATRLARQLRPSRFFILALVGDVGVKEAPIVYRPAEDVAATSPYMFVADSAGGQVFNGLPVDPSGDPATDAAHPAFQHLCDADDCCF